MYKFPIRARQLFLVQPFKTDTQVDFSSALSITTKTHNGVDVVCGTPEQTWGRECVWPFPFPGTVYDAQVDSATGATLHAHSQIDGMDTDGTQYSLVYIHLSAVTASKAPTEDKTIVYKQGDVIGKIGNNGFVSPAPTPEHPLWGTHLHLGLGVKKPGDQNYLMIDPLLYLDINTPYEEQGGFFFSRNLWIGMNNNDVLELQKRLGIDISTGPGNFGPKTFAGVVQYQKAHGISPSGFVGPITRASLNK